MTQSGDWHFERYQALANKLAGLRRTQDIVGRSEGLSADDIAGEAAHSFLDVAQSARQLADVLLPRLEQLPGDSPEVEGVLDDIAGEYMHIYYHIRHSRLLAMLLVD